MKVGTGICLAAAALMLASCVVPLAPSSGGLSVSLGGTVRAVSPLLATWSVSGIGPGAETFLLQNLVQGDTAQVTALALGDWTVTATGFDASGAPLQTGKALVTLVAGETAQASVVLGALNTLNLAVSFGVPGAAEVLVSPVTDGILLFDSSLDLQVSVAVSGEWDSIEWFFDGVSQPGLSGATSVPIVVDGVNLVNPPGTRTFRILLVVEKNGTYSSVDLIVTDDSFWSVGV